MHLAMQLIGIIVVLVALADVYLTVLFARSGTGVLSPHLHRATWYFLRLLARTVPGAFGRVLPHGGPLMLVLTLLLWFSLLVLGCALIVWPELGSAIQASGGRPTPQDFPTAIYFAGMCFTTLGTGDLFATTGPLRILMILQAGLGFSTLTLSLTYFMSIYSALARRNRFALTLHHQTGDTGDPAELVARLATDRHTAHPERELADIVAGLDDLCESHHFYPVLHYFHFAEPFYATGRILFVAMESATLLQTALDENEHRLLVRSPAAGNLEFSGMHLISHISDVFLTRARHPSGKPAETEIASWRERYRRVLQKLRADGVRVASDLEVGSARYIEQRRQWNGAVIVFSEHMGRRWSEIAGGARPAIHSPEEGPRSDPSLGQ